MSTKSKTAANDRISPKEAARRAQTFLRELLGPLDNILLEEVELSDDGRQWLITLSFPEQTGYAPTEPLANLPLPLERRYKRFVVDSRSGEVSAMQIRQV